MVWPATCRSMPWLPSGILIPHSSWYVPEEGIRGTQCIRLSIAFNKGMNFYMIYFRNGDRQHYLWLDHLLKNGSNWIIFSLTGQTGKGKKLAYKKMANQSVFFFLIHITYWSFFSKNCYHWSDVVFNSCLRILNSSREPMLSSTKKLLVLTQTRPWTTLFVFFPLQIYWNMWVELFSLFDV